MALSLIFLMRIPDGISAGGIVIISINVALYVGFGLFYFYISKEKQKFNIYNAVITEGRHHQVKESFKDITFLNLFVLVALFANPQDLFLWFLGTIVIIGNPYFLYILHKKSYFFQKKPIEVPPLKSEIPQR